MKGIDPKWSFWLGVVIFLEQGIGQGTVKLTNVIPGDWIPYVVAWCALLAWGGGALQTAMIGYSSRDAGPLTAPISPAVKSIIILAILATGCFAFADRAQAQILKPLRPIAPRAAATTAPAPVAKSPLTAVNDWLTQVMTDIENVKEDVITGSVDALNEADADAATLTNPADPTSFHDAISHACYPAQIKFLQSLPAAAVIKSPAPYNFIVLFQRKRDFVMLIQAGLPSYLKVGCSALLGDEAAILIKSLGLVGVTVAANAILPGAGGLALPALPALALPGL